MWFDDVYHPRSPAHVEAFSPRERDALAEFHALYGQCADDLPDDLEVDSLHLDPTWMEIAKRAKMALGELKGDS